MGVIRRPIKAYSGASLTEDKSAQVKGLASTAISAAVPGVGQVFSGMDSLSTKLTRNSDGLYKSKGLGALDQAFNPASLINAFSTGDKTEIGRAVLGKATLGLSNVLAPNLFGKSRKEKMLEEQKRKQSMAAQQQNLMQSNSLYSSISQSSNRPYKKGGVLYKSGGDPGEGWWDKIKRGAKAADQAVLAGERHLMKNLGVPLHARQFIHDLTGGEVPLTEKDLTPEELNTLKGVTARRKSAGKIDYDDYKTEAYDGSGKQFIRENLYNKDYAMLNTLGRAKVSATEKGTLVEDQWNINNALSKEEKAQKGVWGRIKETIDFARDPEATPYDVVRTAASNFSSGNGEGSPVRIKLKKKGGMLYKGGGKLNIPKDSSSVIIEGALHSERNNINAPELGEKGVPIIDDAGEKIAEVERDELLFTIEVTSQIESHMNIYKEMKEKGESTSAICLALGKIISKEILENTIPSNAYKHALA